MRRLTQEQYDNVGKDREILCTRYGNGSKDNATKWKHTFCGYEWNTSYNLIQRGAGCPQCAGNLKLVDKDYETVGKDRDIECIRRGTNSKDNTSEWRHSVCGNKWSASYDNIRAGTGCPECAQYKRERLCRQIIEHLTRHIFDKIKPEWLMGTKDAKFELDGYNPILKVGFEHQGRQHYEYLPNYFHKEGRHKFKEQQNRDELKRQLCRDNKICLIEIPYWIPESDLEEFIRQKLMEHVVLVEEK